MNKKTLLSIENLCIGYDNIMAVDNVSLTVDEGSIITIVGQSGSGKSTLIHSILGLLSSNAVIHGGSIKYGEYDLHNIDAKMRREVSGEEISMIFQNSETHMDAIKKIKFQFDEFLKAHRKLSKKELQEIEVTAFEQMGFKDPLRVLSSYPFQLSGGMLQRVSLAMAIALKPRLILADEPTSALDVTLQRQIINQIVELSRSTNTAVLLVTHNMGVATYMSDKIAVMNKGKIVEFADTHEIINHPKHEYTKSLLEAIPKLDQQQLGELM